MPLDVRASRVPPRGSGVQQELSWGELPAIAHWDPGPTMAYGVPQFIMVVKTPPPPPPIFPDIWECHSNKMQYVMFNFWQGLITMNYFANIMYVFTATTFNLVIWQFLFFTVSQLMANVIFCTSFAPWYDFIGTTTFLYCAVYWNVQYQCITVSHFLLFTV